MFTMKEVIPMSWLNQILLILSILVTLLSVIIQEWAGLTPLYISISWAIFIIILSVWLSCFLFQVALKANRPLNIRFVNNWLYNKFVNNLKLQIDSKEKSECISKYENEVRTNKNTNSTQVSKEKRKEKVVIRSSGKDTSLKRKRAVEIYNLVTEINLKCIKVWYKSISDDKSFPNEAQELLKKLLTKLFHKISLIDKIKLTHKLFNVFLLHLKEYQRYDVLYICL